MKEATAAIQDLMRDTAQLFDQASKLNSQLLQIDTFVSNQKTHTQLRELAKCKAQYKQSLERARSLVAAIEADGVESEAMADTSESRLEFLQQKRDQMYAEAVDKAEEIRVLLDFNTAAFWNWEWDLNPCLRSVFIGTLVPCILALGVYLFSGSFSNGPRVLAASDRLLRGNWNGADNRVWVAPVVVGLVCIQAVIQAFAVHYLTIANGSDLSMLISSIMLLIFWIMAALVSTAQWWKYARNDRRRYYGLFNPSLAAFVSAHLIANTAEYYFLFLVPSRWKVPLFDRGASDRSVVLSLALSVDVLIVLLLLIVQSLPAQQHHALALAEESIDVASSAKRFSQQTLRQQQSPENGGSIFDSMLFCWANSFLRLCQRRQPDICDMFEPPEKYTPTYCWTRFCSFRHKGAGLWTTLVYTYKNDIIVLTILNTLMAALNYSQPFLMQQFLRFVSSYSEDHLGLRYGVFLALMMLVFNVVSSQVEEQTQWTTRSLTIQIRSVLVTVLTKKTLDRKAKGSGNPSNGGSAENVEVQTSGRVYNILTADFNRISRLTGPFQLILFIPIQQLIGAWYMYRLLGLAGIAGTLLLILTMYLMRKLVSTVNRFEADLGRLNDQRLAMISEMMHGIMSVKLFGWGSRFISIIGEKRKEQLELLWRRAKVWCWLNLWTASSLPVINFIAFLLYAVGHDIDAATVFTSISVFMIIQETVNWLPSLVADSVSFFTSVKRISCYLEECEVQPLAERIVPNTPCDNEDIGFQHATLAWEPSAIASAFCLNDIDVKFPRGKLSLIGGATGSGKSSMLSALIGEMHLVNGHILVPTSFTKDSPEYGASAGYNIANTAYVAQEPWLCNATIRDNILMGEPLNQARYEKVLGACMLIPDLAVFSASDMTEIGERGITLSGGQKQRVALARAVYSSKAILLIDDCLSAVDVHTSKHILRQCLLDTAGLMQGRTCILVTHHMAMCLPHCGFVVLLDGGKVEFQGSPQQLGAFDAAYKNVESDSGGSSDIEEDSQSSASDPALPVHSSASAAQPSVRPIMANTDGKLISDEVRMQGLVRLEAWKTYFDPCGGWPFAFTCAACLLGAQALAMCKDYFLASHVDGSAESFMLVLAAYLSIGLLSALVCSLTILWMYRKGIQASVTMHDLLLSSIVYAMPRFIETTPIGRIMTRFSKDIQIIDEDVIELLFYFLQSAVSVVLTLVVISTALPQFVVFGIVITVIYARVAWQFMQGQRESNRLEATSYAPLLSLYSEIITGSETIRGFGMHQAYVEEIGKRFTEYVSTDLILRVIRRWLGSRLGLASSTVSFLVAMLILLNIDYFSSGLAGFALIYAMRFLTTSTSVVRRYSSLELSINCVERAHQYMIIDREASPLSDESVKQELSARNWPTTGRLVIKDLVVGYTKDCPVLHGISLQVRHGEKIGIVGRTGAGKSTLTLALLRLVEATSGSIELDDVNIADIGLEDLRQSVTIIPQDPVLFNGTVRFNMDPFGDYSDYELLDALRRTMLLKPARTAAFESLDEEIVSQGQNLSLGQRQLVALARALLRKSKLIIMDEATASVDYETDEKMQQVIRGPEFANSTILCIAHRLRTVADYDRILVLDAGQVAEFDTPGNLLQDEQGVFRNMCLNSGEPELLCKNSPGLVN
ncbi:hypothetical protein LPJ57_000108 [Coemansia sp. RSA 486]|nr:hypothetical protein LPJ57_000108 [Coemansia sp. RSA 486]